MLDVDGHVRDPPRHSAAQEPGPEVDSWPRPTATNSQAGRPASVELLRPPRLTGFSSATRLNRSSSTPLIRQLASLMRVSLAAAEDQIAEVLDRRTGSMPCQNRWLGSISAPTWVAPVSLDEPVQRRRVEDDVVRVHLDADLHVRVPAARA